MSERSEVSLRDRTAHEVTHGEWLAGHDAEATWGWATPAGRIRAARRARLIAEGAGLRPGITVLEVGCGTGLFTEAFVATGATILAVDLSEPLLARARARGLPNERVTFMCKPFEACTTEGPFDAVIGSSVLHHLDVHAALPRLFSLLKPGGRLSFAEPNMLNPQIAVQKNVPWVKRWLGDSPDETAFVSWRIARTLKAHGFTSVSIVPFDWLHPATPAALIALVSRVGALAERAPFVRHFAGSLLMVATHP